MKKLLRNKKGFTLMEMLIVVAIIVILVAISVPTFSSSLDSAKSAADDANYRAAKAAAVVYAVDNEIATDMYYSIEKGEFIELTGTPEAYGQSSAHKGDYIVLTTDGTVSWNNELDADDNGNDDGNDDGAE